MITKEFIKDVDQYLSEKNLGIHEKIFQVRVNDKGISYWRKKNDEYIEMSSEELNYVLETVRGWDANWDTL